MGLLKAFKGDLPSHVGGSSTESPTTAATSENEANFSPLGPPALHSHSEYAPPPGPPPSNGIRESPPPYHDWMTIPDTALLPPPPALGHQLSPSSNATLNSALSAHQWCERRPLLKPHLPSEAHTNCVQRGVPDLIKPQEYAGRLSKSTLGSWEGRTSSGQSDACLSTSLPLYFAMKDSPFDTNTDKTLYFEVKIVSLGQGRNTSKSSLALGFCALPYPSWRMPGWERGSLAIHSDDGRRYVNDTDGGKDFTSPFQAGETVGIGITYSIPVNRFGSRPPLVESQSLNAEVVFTRNGRKYAGWNLHEELDVENEFGILGLDGNYDLYAAIGIFGAVSFEAKFNSQDWQWRPT